MVRRASKTGNKNQRPNSYAGRALKVWMLAEFGDGITVPCSFGCGRRLFYSEITKDRYPIPGRKGGKYAKGNVRPACMSCNAREGARQAALERALEAARRERRNRRRRELYALRKKESRVGLPDRPEPRPGMAAPDPGHHREDSAAPRVLPEGGMGAFTEERDLRVLVVGAA